MATSTSSSSDSFDIIADASEDVKFTVILKLPKFYNCCSNDDFLTALKTIIDCKEIKSLGKLKHSNEWQVTVKSIETRDKLLIAGKLSVRQKKCVILPCGDKQLVGRVHWLPVDVMDETIKNILQNFGDVTQLCKEKISNDADSPESLTRFFLLTLNDSSSAIDIPHFISINQHQGLVIVKGRDPMCLECREVGHRKSECPDKDMSKKSKPKNVKSAGANTVKIGNSSVAIGANATSPSVSVRQKKKNKKATESKELAAVSHASTSNVGDVTQSAQHATNESVHKMADEVKCLKEIMNVFSQKMNEVLTDVGSSLNIANSTNARSVEPDLNASSSLDNISSSKQGKKKKKKKSKTSDNYDLTAAEAVSNDTSSSGQYSPKGSLDSGIALNSHSTLADTAVSLEEIQSRLSKVSSVSVNNSVSSVSVNNSVEAGGLNVGRTTTCTSNQKKKKKNKKKTGSSIPGLTHP